MKYLFSILLLALSFQIKAQEKLEADELKLVKVDMIVRDVLQSAKWYVKHLDFKVKKANVREYAIIENRGFIIHMTKAKRVVTASQIKMPPKKERINGFYELGFLCEDLDSLIFQYEGRPINIVKDKGLDLHHNTNTVVLADPDGNRVKIFQTKAKEKVENGYFKPNYIGITTSDIETSSRWYQSRLGFTETANNYSEHARISYGILERNGLTIELQELSGRTMEITELLNNQVELARVHTISLSDGVKKELTQHTDSDGNKLKY